MPTKRTRRTRLPTVSTAMLEWAKTDEADKFFRGELCAEDFPRGEQYHWPPALKAAIGAKPWHCPVSHIWACVLKGLPSCGTPQHGPPRCDDLRALLIEAHTAWSTKR